MKKSSSPASRVATDGFSGVCVLLLVACQAPPPATTALVDTVAPRAVVATPTVGRPLAVAVAVGSPSPTAGVVGDYPTLVRQRLERVQQGEVHLDQQLAILQKSPMHMAEDDWRTQTHAVLDDMDAASVDLRALGARVGPDAALSQAVLKLLDDLDFVTSEYRMALDFDPDATHFLRAGRAEKTTADEVQSLLTDLQRSASLTRTPTPAR